MRSMLRHLYEGTLVVLQLALGLELAPPLAHALRRGLALGALGDPALGLIQGAAAIAAIGGGAFALSFPLLALLRHRQRGPLRFGGLPRWAVALAVTGGGVFAVGALLHAAVPLLAADARMASVLMARPLRFAGLASMAAGVLWAELLRRSVGVPRAAVAPRDAPAGRIEVTHPRELATHAA
jgi:hypothetical protein